MYLKQREEIHQLLCHTKHQAVKQQMLTSFISYMASCGHASHSF